MARLGHLSRRWWGSLSTSPLTSIDDEWVTGQLLVGERRIFDAMSLADRRHAVAVARRFVARCPAANRCQIAAALLHDVGKTRSGLSTSQRVLATLVGPRTRRFRVYHEHETIGLEMCRGAGSASETLELLAGRGPIDVVEALRRADDL
jgi:hypothetical protein